MGTKKRETRREISAAAVGAQAGVLRILAPDLCALLDEMFDETESGAEVQGACYCPCGEVTWDEDDALDRVRDHDCAFQRALTAWRLHAQ